MVQHRDHDGVIGSTWDKGLGIVLVVETGDAIDAVGRDAVVRHCGK